MAKRRLIQAGEFRDFAHDATSGEILDQDKNPIAIVRDVIASLDPNVDLEAITNRTISYLFSTEKVARDGHTVSVPGFDLTGFDANPVFLWAHDSSQPPIGKVIDITRANGLMRGQVEYAPADLSPFADMIFRMVQQRFINATSISWLPLEWKFSTDRGRPGGIDFIRQDLLEISQVPVPAQATALATARAAGIDTTPMLQWAERVLDDGSNILVPRGELEKLRAASRMPAPARRRNAVAEITVLQPPVQRKFSRDLWQVGELASVLCQLDWIQEWAEWEAEVEGDGSDVPGRLADVVNALGSILVDMTKEEVAELLGYEGDEVTVIEVDILAQNAKTPAQRALLMLASYARAANAHNSRKFVLETKRTLTRDVANSLQLRLRDFIAAPAPSVLVLEDGMQIREMTPEVATPLRALIETRVRAGRVLNAANEAALREACNLIEGVVGQVAAQTDDPVTDANPDVLDATDVAARAARQRVAQALALQESGVETDA